MQQKHAVCQGQQFSNFHILNPKVVQGKDSWAYGRSLVFWFTFLFFVPFPNKLLIPRPFTMSSYCLYADWFLTGWGLYPAKQ